MTFNIRFYSMAMVMAMAFVSSVSLQAVTETDANSGVENNFDANICPNSADLLHNRPISSTLTPDYGFWITGINDGITSSVSNSESSNTFFASDGFGTSLNNNPQVTVKLDTVANPLGYTLTSITSIYGWQNYDRSFSDQKYTVSYSTVSAPTTFVTLANVDYHPFPNDTTDHADGNDPTSSQVTLTNLGTITGVAYLRFTFSVSSGTGGTDPQGGQVIREIQALGAPTRAVAETDASVQGTTGTETTYDGNISNTDLLSGLPSSSFTTTAGPDYQGPLTGIADGTASSNNDGTKNTYFGVNIAGTSLMSDPVVTVLLNTSVNTSGYDLTSINSINGWHNFPSFCDQNYTISYSTVGAPTTFIPLTSVAYTPFIPSNDGSQYSQQNPQAASQVNLTHLTGATGVAALQFTFLPYRGGSSYNYYQAGQMIREIDVFGTPSVAKGGSIDIPPMSWNASARSDWLNVVTGYGADPTGQTDSTAAIQAALDVMNNNRYGEMKTVYFPAGTYKISQTLKLANVSNYQLIGCGLNTTIKWYGASGGAMMWTNSVGGCLYEGFVWDGNNLAGCGYEDYSVSGGYGTSIRHLNESFRNFNVEGTYISGKTYPGAAIMSGYAGAQVTGECTIFNCCFYNCSTAIYNAIEVVQEYMWFIDGCEFENNQVGFNGGNGGSYIITNTHFQQDSYADIVGGRAIWVQRATSSGSGQFYIDYGGRAVLEDCDVDGWTNPGAVVSFENPGNGGQYTVMDCTFTTPPAGAANPVHLTHLNGPVDLLSSNNSAPSFSSLFNLTGTNNIITVPAGARGKNITSATRTFLKSAAITDSANVLDITQPPYNADRRFGTDATSAIQSAIDAAKTANNGTIVYIPEGYYKISSTLNVSGSNYTIQGSSSYSDLGWDGPSNGTIMAISSPQNLVMDNFSLGALDNLTTESHYDSKYPICDPTTVTGIQETSTGASSITYNRIFYSAAIPDGGPVLNANSNGPGIVLSNLPAESNVYIPILYSPLNVLDCGPAQILSKMAYFGTINVSGATHPKTGFLGIVVAEGGQQVVGDYNITVNDNQNIVIGSYYSEQHRNDVNLLRGAGTTTGNVAILGINSVSGVSGNPGGLNGETTHINIDNYAGRLFYGEMNLSDNAGDYPVEITHAGTNPIDLVLANNFFDHTLPTVTTGTGANLIMTLNMYGIINTSSIYYMTDTPNPLTSANLTSISHSFDDLRQLGAVDLSVQFP